LIQIPNTNAQKHKLHELANDQQATTAEVEMKQQRILL
jgi:hypothetical protein